MWHLKHMNNIFPFNAGYDFVFNMINFVYFYNVFQVRLLKLPCLQIILFLFFCCFYF
uniref:Uncharacterized protein n=1 Tax=Anguilla anguilla TaxID=7936 RepID=A0A0E9QMW6_ANGAN